MPNKLQSIESYFLKIVLFVGLLSAIITALVEYISTPVFSQNNVIDLSIIGVLVASLFLLYSGYLTITGIIAGVAIITLMLVEILSVNYLKPGSLSVLFVIALFNSVVFYKRLRIVMHSITLIALITMLSYLIGNGVSLQDGTSLISTSINIVVIYGLIAITSTILKYRYDGMITKLNSANTNLQAARAEIEEKNRKLEEKINELNQLNSQLEEIIHEKTKKIQAQNEQLIQHAHESAHHLRAPVARILGLVNIVRADTTADYHELFSKLNVEIEDLDLVIKRISSDLNEIID